MKNLAYLLILPLSLMLTQCKPGGDTEDNTDGAEAAANLGTVDELDLNQYGFPLVIAVPKAGPTVPAPAVDVLEWGALEIRVGENYAVQISGGDGNMAQVKEDISLDDVYAATYVVDEPDAILYGWAIKDTDMEPEYRFYVIKMDGSHAYEIRNVVDEPFSKDAATRMFDIARACKVRHAS